MQRAYNYYQDRFLDREYGGAFWLLDFHGLVIDNKKKMYGQAFMIYALTEYFAATNNKEALDQAVELFRLIETHNYDKTYKGYYETSNRDWSISEDMRLSTADMNEKKSLNTHLHLMEAYSNLYRVWKEPLVKIRLRELIRDILDFIIDPDTYHFKLFFNEKWHSKSGTISFGHNIEGSWLLCEAAEILGDATLSKSVQQVALKIAQVVLDEGVNSNGAVYSDKDEKNVIAKKYCWWTQAEAVVGFINAYQISHDDAFIRMALKVWNYIETHFVDTKYGEWYNELSENHRPNRNRYKVSEWKGPYHNSRACMEIMRRLDVLYK